MNSNLMRQNQINEYEDNGDDDDDDDDYDDYANKIIEESPNSRWSKLDQDITSSFRLIDFDSTYLCIDNEKGTEAAWNEMKYSRSISNRFSSIKTLESISNKLEDILRFLIDLDHSNILKFFEYWFLSNENDGKLVVITEYSTAGSLKKVLDSYNTSNIKLNRTGVKPPTVKRWLNQILYSIKHLQNQNISLFQGHLNAENIFIQSSGAIKVAPILLALNGVCDISNGLIRSSIEAKNFNRQSSLKLERIALTNKMLMKDVHAIGRLAIEIFTAHLKSKTPISPTSKVAHFDLLSGLVNLDEMDFFLRNKYIFEEIKDEIQKDFILKCLNANEKSEFESIWSHPLINEIYSLKVLSVFCILTYFHDKKKSKNSTLEKTSSIRNSTNTLNNIPNILISDTNSDENTDVFYSGLVKRQTGAFEKNTDSEYLRVSLKHAPPSSFSNHLKHRKLSLNTPNFSNSPPKFIQNGTNQVKLPKNGIDKRKVSLTFLTNYNDLKIPHHFFSILEDIRTGLYPRLFKEIDSNDLNLDMISSSTCLDFVIQQKNLIDKRSDDIDRRSSVPNGFLMTRNNSDGRNKTPSELNSNKTMHVELRRLASEDCSIKIVSGNMIELRLSLKFQDDVYRTLRSYFPEEFLNYLKDNFSIKNESMDLNFLKNPFGFDDTAIYNERPLEEKIENVCNHLANELIDFGLINKLDHDLVSELFGKTIKEYLFSLMPNKYR